MGHWHSLLAFLLFVFSCALFLWLAHEPTWTLSSDATGYKRYNIILLSARDDWVLFCYPDKNEKLLQSRDSRSRHTHTHIYIFVHLPSITKRATVSGALFMPGSLAFNQQALSSSVPLLVYHTHHQFWVTVVSLKAIDDPYAISHRSHVPCFRQHKMPFQPPTCF